MDENDMLEWIAYMAEKAIDNGNMRSHMYWAKRFHALTEGNPILF